MVKFECHTHQDPEERLNDRHLGEPENREFVLNERRQHREHCEDARRRQRDIQLRQCSRS